MFDPPSFLQHLSTTLLQFREAQLLCDTILTVDNEDPHCFWAHSVILAAASPLLCAAFTECKSSPQWCRFRVQLPGCDPCAIEAVLHFLYSGNMVLPTGCQKSEEFKKIVSVLESIGVPLERLNGTAVVFDNQQTVNRLKSIVESIPLKETTGAAFQVNNVNTLPDNPQQVTKTQTSHDLSVSNNDELPLPLPASDDTARDGKALCSTVSCNADKQLLLGEPQPKGDMVQASTSPKPATGELHQLKHKLIISQALKIVKSAKQCKMCPNCHRTFQSVAHMKTHLRVCKPAPYSCTVCKKTFIRMLWYQSHLKRVHGSTDSSLFTCSTCSCTFNSLQKLRSHQFLHTTDRPHVCDVCGKSYRFRTSLIEHTKSAHSGNLKPYLCELCGRAFAVPMALWRHTRRRHIDDRSHVCSKCGKGYGTRYQLRDHAVICQGNAKPYTCSTCGVSFTRRHNMLRHQRQHSNTTAHLCAFCNKTFRHKQNVAAHVRRVHMTTYENQLPEHVCSVCMKSFGSDAALKSHESLHANSVRTHVCQTCNKGFTQLRYLNAHRVVHQEKQVSCPTCARRFAHVSHLSLHIKKKHAVI